MFKLLGWSFAEEGAKAPDFASSANALGASVDVSELHLGAVKIDNTTWRKEDLAALVNSIVSNDKLTSIKALKSRGPMQFTAGQLFGRVARKLLNQVTQHAYRWTKVALEPETASALKRYSAFLTSGKPRVTRNLSDSIPMQASKWRKVLPSQGSVVCWWTPQASLSDTSPSRSLVQT